ncbi:MAG: tetratricopeptide repeat protein [Verrucomicrobia bacterium]|nr:tetratricopeptide repeat protein [Verrucomicrobiota bacterium]
MNSTSPGSLVIVLLAVVGHAAAPAPDTVCRANLDQLGAGIRAYRLIHDGRNPAKLSDLYLDGLVNDLSLFACPAAAGGLTNPADVDARSHYTLEPIAGAKGTLVREKTPAHENGKVLAAFDDGSVKLVSLSTSAAPLVTPPRPPVTPPPPLVVATNTPPVRPVSPDWPGRDLFAAGRYAEALPKCEAFLAANPSHRQARYDRGVMRLWLNDPPGALAEFRTLAASDPNDIESRRLRALVELMVGKPEVARAEAEALKRLRPQDPHIVLLHAQAAMWTQDAPAALQSFAEVRRLDPGVTARLYEEANRFLKAGVGIAAAQEYVTVLYLDRQQAGAYFGLGFARLLLGQRTLAIDAFQRYLQLDSTSAYADQVRQQLRQLGQ